MCAKTEINIHIVLALKCARAGFKDGSDRKESKLGKNHNSTLRKTPQVTFNHQFQPAEMCVYRTINRLDLCREENKRWENLPLLYQVLFPHKTTGQPLDLFQPSIIKVI